MDILKARQKAKEQKQREAEEKAREVELRADIERARDSAAPVDEGAGEGAEGGAEDGAGGGAEGAVGGAGAAAGAAAGGAAGRAAPRAAARAAATAAATAPATSSISEHRRSPAPGAPIDPLHEFLAIYDEGELAYDVSSRYTGDADAVHDDERRFLSFDLAGEAYAASIMDIREILKVVSLTEVPRAPKEVLGVLSKRGVVMPVADLAVILGLRASDKKLDRDQRVLVAGDGDRVCGLRVDRVRQVVRLAQRTIEDVPPSLGNKNAHMLLGLGRARVEGSEVPRMLILLDVPAVLAHFAETMGIAPMKEAASR